MGNALLNAVDLLVFLRVDTFVSTLFSKACVYFHNYSLRCYLKISKRCGDSYISRRVRKEKKAIRFQRFFFLHDSKRRMNWNNVICFPFVGKGIKIVSNDDFLILRNYINSNRKA